MSSQPFISGNIMLLLRQLRSQCYSNQVPSVSRLRCPSRSMCFEAYNSYASSRRFVSDNDPSSSITVQPSRRTFYSTVTSSYKQSKPARTNVVEDVIPDTPKSTKPKTAQPAWGVQKKALQTKFEEGWKPRKKLSPDTMESVRKLHSMDSVKFSTRNLSEQFKVSPEAIRRILKSKWKATESEEIDRRERWEKRKIRINKQMEELGLRRPEPTFKEEFDTEQGPTRTKKDWRDSNTRSAGSFSDYPRKKRPWTRTNERSFGTDDEPSWRHKPVDATVKDAPDLVSKGEKYPPNRSRYQRERPGNSSNPEGPTRRQHPRDRSAEDNRATFGAGRRREPPA